MSSKIHTMPQRAVVSVIAMISLLLVCFAFLTSVPAAAAPTTMNFQGRLADSSGSIMPDGLYNMQFRLFTVASGGSATWTETRETTNRVQVTNGLFSVQLGSVTPLSASLFSGNDVYFEITLPTPATATCSTASCASWESAMTPRHKMATSAYAFQAENTNTLDGLDSTAFAAATGSANYIQNTTTPQTADFAITGIGRVDTTLQAPSIQRATAGSLSIGTTTTTTGMTIGGTGITGTLAITTGTSGTINIGSTANARTITIGNVAAIQSIIMGSTNTTSSTTIQGGTSGSISLATGGAINLNSSTIATNATTANFLNTTATTVNAFGAATTLSIGADSGTATINNSNVTVGNTTNRGTFTNNGATLNSTLALGNLGAGAIGTAATTVDIYSGVTISPTAAGRTYTVPSPTTATAGRTFYISNINGTNSFIVLGQTIEPNTTVTLNWGGSAWTISAAGANTNLSNLSSTNINAALNTTSGNLTLQTTTSGNIVLNPVGTVELQKSTNVTGNVAATGTVTGSNLSGTNTGDVGLLGQNYLTIAGQTITANAINLASSHVTGTLALGNGGTGATTAQGAINAISGLTTNGDLLFHNGSNATRLARGTNGQCLTSNATSIQWGSCGLSAEADTLADVTGRGATTTTALALQGGATIRGITVETATVTQDQIILAAAAVGANRFAGTITNADLTAARTYTLPNASGTFAVSASGNIALSAAGDITFTGSLTDAQVSDTLTASNLVGSGSTTNAVDLGTAEVAGTLGVANGGTGATTTQGAINAISQLTTNGDLLYHNGTNSTRLARGTNGQCLTSNATTLQWGSCGLTAEADTLDTVVGRGATTTTAVSLQGGATIRGLTVETATVTQDQIILAAAATGASRFAGTITNADLTAARTYTLPNASGTFAVSASGNIALSAAGDITFTGSLTDAQVSNTLTSSIFVGSGSTTNAVDLGTAEVAGTLGVANGGTGATTAQGAINAISGLTTTGDLLYYNGTNTIRLARGTNGQCLTSNSTTIIWGSCGLSAEADTLATVTGRGATTATATTFSGGLTASGTGTGLSVTNNATIGGTLGVTGAITGSSTIQGTRFISTVAVGTAPLTVTSTTKVANLNVDRLDDLDSTAFGQIAANNSWTGTNTVGVTNAAAFRVQNAGGTAVITADTSSGAVLLGQASTSNGTLRFNNSSNANTVSLVSGATSSSYTLTLPTAVGSAGQCLSDTNGSGVLGWTNCGNGSKKVTLTAEYPGAVLKADGTNNNGTMTSDFVSGLSGAAGYKHTFYDWSTSQATAQDYDIYVTHQLPNDVNASTEFDAGSWKVWTYVDNLANSAITMTVYDNDGTACANGVSIEGGSTGWSQITLTDFDTNASCDFTAGSIITIKMTLSSTSPNTNHVRVAGIEYSYTP